MGLMKKILKLFLILVAIIIPGIVIAAIAAVFLVDPNHFKPQLVHIAEQKLGRKLVIDGDFALQFYPYIAMTLNQAHLKNPDSFGPNSLDFAYIDTAKLKIDLLPLLKGRIQVEELVLDGLKLNLTRLTPTQDNWSDLVTNIKKASENKEPDESENDNNNEENGNLAKGKFKLKLHETTIQQAELLYQDKPANKSYQLKNLNFHTKKLRLNKPTAINGDFIFIADNLKTNMAYTGEMQFKSKENKLEFTPLNLKSTLISNKLPNGKISSNLSSTIKADWKNQTFYLQNLTLKFDDSIAKGSANLDFSKGLSARFDLGINALQVAQYLPDTHLTLNKIQANGTFSNKVLNLSALKANLYNGNFQGSTKITFAQQNQYRVNGKFNQINIQNLLSELKNINKISGSTNATLDLSTSGNKGDALKRNLTGKVYVDIRQGYLHGFDVEYYLNKAQMLAKKNLTEGQLADNKKTPFDQLSGNFIFQNGVISNQDLHGAAPFYDLTGAGTIDLVQEQIQYRLKATSLKNDGSARKVPLAVIISGPLYHPKVAPDMETYLQAFVQEKIEKQINKQLEKHLGITLPGTSNSTQDNGNTDGSNNSTDKKALQKELLNKGLQKLFGH